MSRFAYDFTGKIAHHSFGDWGYTVVYLPVELAAQLPLKQYPRLRVRGELDDYPFAGAWQPTGEGWYLMIPKAVMKQGKYQLGDWLGVRFNIDDQNAVDLPPELESALRGDKALAKLWARLTPGKQRAIAHHVGSAKTEATRLKRIEAARPWIESGELPNRKTG